MEEKCHSSVVVELALPAAFPNPHADDGFESPHYRNTLRDLIRGDAENSLAFRSQMAAGVVSGVAISVVSYRIFKTKCIKAVFQSKSVTKDMTYLGILYGAAEFSSQKMRNRETGADAFHSVTREDESQTSSFTSAVDFSSVKNVAFFGASLAAPLFHFWYRFLDARFVGTAPSTLVKKVALDQLFASSSVSALFLVSMPAFQGEPDLFGAESLLFRKFPTIYLTGCAFWPLAQIINFRFVSTRYRVAYLGCAAFLWTSVLCVSRH